MLPEEIPGTEKKKKNVFATVGNSGAMKHDCELTDEGLPSGLGEGEDIRSYLPVDYA